MARSLFTLWTVGLLTCTAISSASTLKLDFKKERRNSLVKRSSGYLNLPALEDVDDLGYYVNLSIGSPPQVRPQWVERSRAVQLTFRQPFTVSLDTGSSDLWVPNLQACSHPEQEQGCAFGGFFSPEESSTYQSLDPQTIVLPYGIGGAEGIISSDNVHIQGVEIQNQTFYLVSEVEDQAGVGIMGIGYPAGEVYAAEFGPTYPTIVDALFNQGVINRRAFSLYLDDQESGLGSVIFGGIDSSKYTGDLVSVAVTPNGTGQYDRFAVDLSAISFVDESGSTLLTSPHMASRVTLDSGSTLSYLPQNVTQAIATGLGASYLAAAGVYIAPCAYRKVQASVSFQFGGSNGPTLHVELSQLLGDYYQGENFGDGTEACTVNIAALSAEESDELDTLILGDSFLRSVYAVYDLDNNEIALAQAKFDQTGTSNIQAIPSGSGLPGVSSTATQKATQFPFPSSLLTQTATGNAIAPTASADETATAISVPEHPKTPTFSLGVTATDAAGQTVVSSNIGAVVRGPKGSSKTLVLLACSVISLMFGAGMVLLS